MQLMFIIGCLNPTPRLTALTVKMMLKLPVISDDDGNDNDSDVDH